MDVGGGGTITSQISAIEIGTVLSGGTSRGFNFVIREEMEQRIHEGMYVVARSGDSFIVAMVEGLEYYHEFYQEGEVWIASVRRGRRIPEGLAARQYLRASARSVAEVSSDGLVQVRRPPRPGSPVYLVGPDLLEKVVGWDPTRPGEAPGRYLPFGYLLGYEGKKYHAYLDLHSLTMHFAVMGTTGSGKSNTMGLILEEIARKSESDVLIARVPGPISALVVDVNNDYVDFYRYPDIVGNYSRVIRLVLKGSMADRIAPPSHYKSELRRLTIDLNALSGGELAEAIVTLYRRGTSESSALQLTYLEGLLSDWERLCSVRGFPCRVERAGRAPDFNKVFSTEGGIRLLEKAVREDVEGKRVDPRTAATVMRQIYNFSSTLTRFGLIGYAEAGRFNRAFVDEITDPGSPKLVLLDLGLEGATGADLSIKQFIVYYVARVLFNRFVEYKVWGGSGDRVLLFVIEEAQNFAPNLSQYPIGYSIARNILSLVATQGRKFGLSLALVTQRPRYVDPTILNMMNTFIIHRVAPADVGFVENVTGGVPRGLKASLTVMERGVAIVVGQMNPSPHPLLVRVKKRAHHDVAGT